MKQNSEFKSEYDLSGEADDLPQNNVMVVLDRDVPIDVKPYIARKDERILSLLRGGPINKKNQEKDDEVLQQVLFKLLSLNELDQAIVNISYYYDLSGVVPPSARSSFKITGLDEIGLSFNKNKFCIEGVPDRLGSYQVSISFDLKGSPFSKMLSINVITLWKEVDPPQNLIFPKSNSDTKSIVVDLYKKNKLKNLVAASQRGRSHGYDGKPRDDDFCIYYDQSSGWYIASVADGAGSAKLSREGSKIFTEILEEDLKKLFNDKKFDKKIYSEINRYKESLDDELFERNCRKSVVEPIKNLLEHVLDVYKQKVKEIEGSKLYDFSTTCLFTFFKKYDEKWLLFSFNIGDGAIGMIDESNQSSAILCHPDEGTYFGQTRFITTEGVTEPEDIFERIFVKFVRDFDALLLMTDGVTDPKFETDKNLHDSRCWREFYLDLKQNVEFCGTNDEIENQLLEYLNFWSIGNHDDRTIVVVY